MKRRLHAILVLLVILGMNLFSLTGYSMQQKDDGLIPVPQVKANTFVYDEDNILDANTRESLNKMLVELESKTGAEFAIITIKSLQDRTLEDYANKTFNTLGIGKKGEDNGFLLLISKSDKRVRLEAGRGFEGIISDQKCGQILDKYFVPYRDKGDYLQATSLTTQAVVNIIAKDKQVVIDGTDPKLGIDQPWPLWVWILIIIVIIILVTIEIKTNDGTGGIFFGSSGMFSGGSDGDSGGGGGFGGGFSGGGGASR